MTMNSLYATTDISAPRERRERKGNADKRRKQILDATIRSIAVNGLSKTTLATVAKEAGLSQGVAVFYFKSKDILFSEAFRAHYAKYAQNWRQALEDCNGTPRGKLMALIEADFAPEVCNAQSLAVWHAFWGEASARPIFAEISDEFDKPRGEVIRDTFRQLLPGRETEQADHLAACVDSLTDGLWLKIHLAPEFMDRKKALQSTLEFLDTIIPAK